MTLKLESVQESVLEELMQKSFGAQNLYVPKNYKKRGDREKEPCDLTWFGNSVLVLFYLTSGKKAIEKQDEHNLKQGNKWIKYWKNQPNHHLKATNRYGDELSITFKDVTYCILISVISHNTGIVFHNYNQNKPIGYTCTVPEALIHTISELRGTVIDLLEIIQKYSTNLRRHIIKHGPLSGERLKIIVDRRVKEIDALWTSHANTEIRKNDFSFIYKMIDISHRLPAPIGDKLMASLSLRQVAAGYFTDMSARDFILLALTAANAIERTCSGKYSIAAVTTGMHMNWIVYATTIGARNYVELFNNTLKQIEAKGFNNLPIMIYGYGMEGMEYRSPFMHILPPERKSIQAIHLVELTVQRLSIVIEK